MRGLGDIARALSTLLPTWALIPLGLAVAVFLLRGFDFRTRDRQIREAVRRLVRAEPDARDALVARAYERAGGHPDLLELVAAEATRRQMPDVQAGALARLEALPGGRARAERFRRGLGRPDRLPPVHPVEAAVRVRALLDEGLVEAARLRLDEVEPADRAHPALAALRDEIDVLQARTDRDG